MRLRRRGLLLVRVGRASVRAEARHRGTVTWSGEAKYDSPEDLADTIARLASLPAEPCRRLTVEIERPPVQTRTLTDLPPVKDRELVALVAHQAARYFRRNGHSLVTDALWMGTGTARVAHAAAIEEPVVEAIAAGARAGGLVLEGLAPADTPVPLSLLPGSERTLRARAERKLLRRLGVATACVWAVVIALGFVRLLAERRAIERQLAALQTPLTAVLAARRELREAEATLQAVAGAERERGRSLELLGALVGALPDSAVLTSVTWSADGSGMITGYGRRAADVLARLERTDALRSARLDGPIVKEAVAGREWERFTIVFKEQGARSREQIGP